MNIIESPKNFEGIELEIIRRKIEEGRKEFEIFLQSAATKAYFISECLGAH